MSSPTVVIGSDHAGFDLKVFITGHLQEAGFEVKDLGARSKESCDYPLVAGDVCREVLASGHLGILICGTGMGMSMAANRFPGIRAALCTNEYLARASAHLVAPDLGANALRRASCQWPGLDLVPPQAQR